MGKQRLTSFGDEMRKLARLGMLKSLAPKGLKELGGRLRNPVSGMREGWKSLGPEHAIKSQTQGGRWLEESLAKPGTGMLGKMRRGVIAGEHLTGDTGAQGVKGLAERASRAGFTGTGSATKYLPIGDKTQFGLGTALTLPDIVNAAQTDEKDLGRALGSAGGSTGGWLMTSGLPGFVVPWASSLAFEQMGRGAGQVLDKVRGG